MVFGTADVLNSARFDLIFVSTRSDRCVHGKFSRQLPLDFPLTRLTYGLLSVEIVVELEKKFTAASIFDCLD